MSKKFILFMFVSLFMLNACTRAWNGEYEVISTKKNTVIEYRTMKSKKFKNCVTELKKVNLPKSGKWSKDVVLHNGNVSTFCPEDELYFELIVRGEGEGTIFAGFLTPADINDTDAIEGNHVEMSNGEVFTNYYKYIYSNETANNYLKFVVDKEQIHQ